MELPEAAEPPDPEPGVSPNEPESDKGPVVPVAWSEAKGDTGLECLSGAYNDMRPRHDVQSVRQRLVQ